MPQLSTGICLIWLMTTQRTRPIEQPKRVEKRKTVHAKPPSIDYYYVSAVTTTKPDPTTPNDTFTRCGCSFESCQDIV